MKYTKWKTSLTILAILAAGTCYSCSADEKWQEIAPSSQREETEQEFSVSGSDAESSLRDNSSALADAGESKEMKGSDAMETAAEQTEESGSQRGEPFCYVHVCGEVANPGVYEMEEGSRVFQAVEAAGGFTELAAVQYLNMALPVSDGMKLMVPSLEQVEQMKDSGRSEYEILSGEGVSSSSQQKAGNTKVNINTASKEELTTLTGIGEARADDIIEYRDKSGGFNAIEDIMNVPGIKEGAFEKIKDEITV